MQNPHIATEISSGYTNLIISITARSLKLKTQLATWLRWYGNVWMISLPSVLGALTRIWEDIPVQQVGLGLISWANRLDYHSGWDVSLVLLKKPDNTAETQTSSGYSSFGIGHLARPELCWMSSCPGDVIYHSTVVCSSTGFISFRN